MKSKTLPQLIKKADRVMSYYIRQLEGGKCYTCGKVLDWKYQDAGHYIKRSCWQLRWDERNVHCQCTACNRFRDGNMGIYAVALMRQYGKDILFEFDEILRKSKAQPQKPSRLYLESIIKQYDPKQLR